jgi:hypothetical protein
VLLSSSCSSNLNGLCFPFRHDSESTKDFECGGYVCTSKTIVLMSQSWASQVYHHVFPTEKMKVAYILNKFRSFVEIQRFSQNSKRRLITRVSHKMYSCFSSSAHAIYMVCTSHPRIVTNNTQSEFLLKQSFLPNFQSSRVKAAPEKAMLSVYVCVCVCVCACFYANMSDRVYNNFLIA